MRPEEDIKRVKKANMFSQNETVQLTGFTRGQLIKWDESNIVKPYRHPCILYDWNQVIFLRILYYWREKASYQKIERILSDDNIDKYFDKIIEHLEKYSLAFFNDQKLIFVNDSFYENQNLFSKIAKVLEVIDIESVDYYEIIPGVVLLNIKSIVYNLKKEGEKLKIENFAMKIG